MAKKKRHNDTKKNNTTNTKSSEGNEINGIPNDKHCNRSTPCSDLAVAIVQEIFPSVAELSPSDDVGDKHGGDSPSGSDKKQSNAGGSNNKKQDYEPPTKNKEVTEQPLLGYMIQRYLIEERKKVRGAQGGGVGVLTSTNKKKKNKKKKKKKSANNNNNTINTASNNAAAITIKEGEVELMDKGVDLVGDNVGENLDGVSVSHSPGGKGDI